MISPYAGLSPDSWHSVTDLLLEQHPLSVDEIVDVVLTSWNSIFESRMGSKGFRIGYEILPKPQIMGFLLHELIPLEFAARHPGVWRPEKAASDKDIVHIPDNSFSIELKTSSSARQIFGNRSYAQQTSQGKKAKTGYYLAVNFEKFQKGSPLPRVGLVRFGWLDSSDWIGQRSATGQQARLLREVEELKLRTIYRPS